MNKPVLLLVMSKQCGACAHFKRKILPELEKELKNDSRINFIILDFPEMMVPVTGSHHPELKNGFVRFFPTFILFPGNLWNNHKSKLKGVIKHGDELQPRVDYSKNSILTWINETLKNPIFIDYNNEKNMGAFAKSIDNGRFIVPTIGTYNRFKNTRLDETEL